MTLAETLIAEPPPLKVDEHGVICVGGTRVTLDTVLAYYQQGQTPEDIAEGFDTLQLGDIYAVISYYLRHREDVDAYLEERRIKAAELRHQIEERWPSKEFRERLLVRRSQMEQ